jgi:hypothetical protein
MLESGTSGSAGGCTVMSIPTAILEHKGATAADPGTLRMEESR